TALEQGRSPDDPVDGSTPCVIPNPGGQPDPWTPSNFEDEAFGEMSLTDATVHSVNCAYSRLALQVGLNHIVDTAHQMGITAPLPGRPGAGKTGTAENYQDAWFVGYTPQLATAVWMGDATAEAPMRGVGGIDVVGGSYPAQIWSAFMGTALAPLPVVDFTPP